LIKRFQLCFELAFKVLKDFLEQHGETEIFGSKDAFRLAFQRGIIAESELWMEMVESRIKAGHTYDEEKANALSKVIYSDYFRLFGNLAHTLEKQIVK
jgi:nucleotidyltransferase substrate binding protein (TIGR01987 family)